MADFVLVHGARHGSWCWERLVPELELLGHQVVTVDLPGNGAVAPDLAAEDVTVASYANHVAKVLATLPGPAVVVGHSLGGLTISATAELVPDRISKLVYLTAFVPSPGRSVLDVAGELSAITVDINASEFDAARYFYSDCSAADSAWATARLTAQPRGPLFESIGLTPERFGRVPRAYVRCTDDQILTPAAQTAMAERGGCDPVIDLPRSHSPFLSAPGELASALVAAAGVA